MSRAKERRGKIITIKNLKLENQDQTLSLLLISRPMAMANKPKIHEGMIKVP